MLLCILLLTGCRGEEAAPVVYLPAATPKTETIAPATAAPTPTPAPTPVPSPVPTATPLTEQRALELYVEQMDTRQKIGQLVMFGFSGTRSVSNEFARLMEQYAIGNVILYGPNIARTDKDGGFARCAALTDSVNAHNVSGIPLLISTDVEGGNVTRFKWKNWPTHAATLGKKADEHLARRQFAAIGEGLLSAGINTDLAPVLDTAKSPGKTFLGKRIISSEAAVTGQIGVACIEGLHGAGCLSIVKHFPGHGATSADSHETTPVVKKSLEELWDYELLPFAQAVEAGVDGVMVAHIAYPNIDGEHIASQSPVLMDGVLRQQMGFEGLILSDDFRMAGLRKQTSVSDGAVQFILSGGDIILCGANHSYQAAILEGLTAAVADGTLPESRLNESVTRILKAKMQVTDWQPPLPLPAV